MKTLFNDFKEKSNMMELLKTQRPVLSEIDRYLSGIFTYTEIKIEKDNQCYNKAREIDFEQFILNLNIPLAQEFNTLINVGNYIILISKDQNYSNFYIAMFLCNKKVIGDVTHTYINIDDYVDKYNINKITNKKTQLLTILALLLTIKNDMKSF